MPADEALWQSARNIKDSQDNLNRLFDSFAAVECSQGPYIREADWDAVDEEFIQPVWNYYFSVHASARANSRINGWITAAIQLTCNDGVHGDWPSGRRSKVLVGYSDYREYGDAWVFDTNSPNKSGHYDDCQDRRDHWIYDDDCESSWFYAVQLSSLASTEAVQENIVRPVHAILQGEDISSVLAPIQYNLYLPHQ